MIKKSTLIILLAAVILGAAAYFFDWKRGQKDAENGPSDTTKPAFTLRTESDDFSSLTISYPADPKSQPIHFEKQDGAWQITQPLQTSADDASLQGIVQQLASARVAQTEPGTPDRLNVNYRSEPPLPKSDIIALLALGHLQVVVDRAVRIGRLGAGESHLEPADLGGCQVLD